MVWKIQKESQALTFSIRILSVIWYTARWEVEKFLKKELVQTDSRHTKRIQQVFSSRTLAINLDASDFLGTEMLTREYYEEFSMFRRFVMFSLFHQAWIQRIQTKYKTYISDVSEPNNMCSLSIVIFITV